MISKYIGIALMVLGVVMALGVMWSLVVSLVAVVWQVAKIGMMLFVAFVGYRLWRQHYLTNV